MNISDVMNRHQSENTRTKLERVLLSCGILSSLLYAAMNIIAPMLYEGYSPFSQTVSELSAIGAPTRPLWVLLGTAYEVLLIAFGVGVWKSAGRKRALRVVGLLLVGYGVFGLAWPPMHQRVVLAAGGATLTDTLHLVWSGVTVLGMLLFIGFGAAAFGKRFRLYSIGTILVLLVFGVLTSLYASRVGANLPTPWVGVWERINIFGYLLWIVVLAIILLRAEKGQGSANGSDA
jgi:hypothetical protein